MPKLLEISLDECRNGNLPALPNRGTPITAAQLREIEQQIATAVFQVNDVATLDEWRAKAAALEAYLRDKELQTPMRGAQRRVEARIGQLLGPSKYGPQESSVMTEDLDKDERHDFRILANAFEPETEITEEEWRKSRRALVALIRLRLGLIPPTPALPDGKYRIIVADPPWRLDTGPNIIGGTIESGHDDLSYNQMSLDEIRNLAVKDRAADDAHLYLWTINKYVEHSYGIARDWGFKPSVLLVWAKTPHGIGLGDAYRLTTEFCLYARRGNLKERAIIETTWFNWPRGKHSTKPKEFYEMVERMTPAHGSRERLEMFARSKRDGWTVWGNEVS
jgi:N6-adenosine-specific RNA methylase IME4